VLRHDGTVAPLRLARKSPPPPSPRFSHAMVSVPVSGNSDHNSNSGDGGGVNAGRGSGLRQVAFLFGGCRGDGSRAAANEAFVLDMAGGAGGGLDGAGEGGIAEEARSGHGIDGEDAQTDKTVTFNGGDLYTGQLDADGHRQGKGRCDYRAAVGTAAGEEATTATRHSSASESSGGGGGGGSYLGEWDADEPHGRGERVYPPPREVEGNRKGVGGDGGGGEAGGTVDMAIMSAAFGPECPPLASYRGDFKRGIREGNGVCSFFALGAMATAGPLGATRKNLDVLVPESYDGEWMDGRPLGRGVLTLREAAAAAAAAPSSGPYPSSVPGSGGGGDSGGGSNTGSGSSIEGVWTEEGLIQGKEKLPGKGGVYEGQYRLGRREGHGRLELPDGSEYEG
ncbi:unnamed protein product, partial [Hapterophycus canaliculatus]